MGRSCAGNALSACWTTCSGVPVDSCASKAVPLLRAPTQVPWRRSACATPTFRENGRCLPPPPQNAMARGRPVRAPSAVGESGWASRVDSASQICTRGGLEGDYQDGRCLPPPPQNPMARGRPVRAPSALGESGWASRVNRASQICTRGAGRRENRIFEAAIESPAGGFDACGARAVTGRTATLEKSLYTF